MPQPLFILCPLRSFSSLVCAMLGEHPEFMGMAELNLFLDDDVIALHRSLERRGRSNGKGGVLRVLAQLMYGEQTNDTIEQAQEWLYEQDLSSHEVMEHIRALAHPRAIIDKSPATVMSLDSLHRMRNMYPDANYLHLTRHPRSCCNSICNFIDMNLESGRRLPTHRIDPEKLWLEAQLNILDFCDQLPPGQSMRIKGEDLLSSPSLYFPQIFEWLDARTDQQALSAALHPENSPFACIGPDNAKWGNDPNFLEQPVFRPGNITLPRLAGPLDWDNSNSFRPRTLAVAAELGYADPGTRH